MTRINIAAMLPLDFLKFSDPIDPQYFMYSPWRWLPLQEGGQTFPLIKPASIDALNYWSIGDIGPDYDGSQIGIVLAGPERGSTIVVSPPVNEQGQFIPPKLN